MSIANQQILNNLPHPEDEELTLDSMVKALDTYCDEKIDCDGCRYSYLTPNDLDLRCKITKATVASNKEESVKELYIDLYQNQEYEKGLNNPFLEEQQEEPKESTEDLVNHPSHYTHGGMECIDEMLMIFGREAVMYFCVCNAWKYRKRALYKNGYEDMKKSDWYINKFKELEELNQCKNVSPISTEKYQKFQEMHESLKNSHQ